jgi:cation diffusion facilitator CzcD-associated flavoprotein CzcO
VVRTNCLTIGAVTAAAFVAEKYFEQIQVFERRESAGGTWYFGLYTWVAHQLTK